MALEKGGSIGLSGKNSRGCDCRKNWKYHETTGDAGTILPRQGYTVSAAARRRMARREFSTKNHRAAVRWTRDGRRKGGRRRRGGGKEEGRKA